MKEIQCIMSKRIAITNQYPRMNNEIIPSINAIRPNQSFSFDQFKNPPIVASIPIIKKNKKIVNATRSADCRYSGIDTKSPTIPLPKKAPKILIIENIKAIFPKLIRILTKSSQPMVSNVKLLVLLGGVGVKKNV